LPRFANTSFKRRKSSRIEAKPSSEGRLLNAPARACHGYSLEPDRIAGIKNVTASEPLLIGHYPDFPVMPLNFCPF
jgi:hypothetical protein